MSLVGPRPLLPQYLARYSSHHRHRHDVRPGVTGLAQVSGRNTLSWPERFDLDVEYVERCSVIACRAPTSSWRSRHARDRDALDDARLRVDDVHAGGAERQPEHEQQLRRNSDVWRDDAAPDVDRRSDRPRSNRIVHGEAAPWERGDRQVLSRTTLRERDLAGRVKTAEEQVIVEHSLLR